jgi:hypothetical protein
MDSRVADNPHMVNQPVDNPHMVNQPVDSPHMDSQVVDSPHMDSQLVVRLHMVSQLVDSLHMVSQVAVNLDMLNSQVWEWHHKVGTCHMEHPQVDSRSIPAWEVPVEWEVGCLECNNLQALLMQLESDTRPLYAPISHSTRSRMPMPFEQL